MKNFINIFDTKFEQVYEVLLEKYKVNLEIIKKKTQKLFSLLIFFGILSLISLIFTVFALIELKGNISIISMGLFLVLMIISIIFLVFAYKQKYIYIDFYKKNIINNFIKLIDETYNYIPNLLDKDSDIIKDKYREAKFDNKYFNFIAVDDCIEGIINGNDSLCLADLEAKIYINLSGANSIQISLFKGFFAYVEIKKNINNFVKISKNKAIVFNKSRIDLVDKDINTNFYVYSDNKELVTRVLTIDNIQKIINFYNEFKVKYDIVIKNNYMYFRFGSGKMFEPKLFGNIFDKGLLYKEYNILKSIIEIIKNLDENLKEIRI